MDTLTDREYPLISIIIPAYNIENYIERCLETVQNQTYRNLQIILVDDGSTDRTGEIIDAISERDSRVLAVHNKNQGVSSARNSGLDIAEGEYIGFVDGDDIIEPDMYQKMLEEAITYKADIVHCGYKMVFPNRVDAYYGTGEKRIQNTHKGIVDLLEGKPVEPGIWNKLYYRDIVSDLRFEPDIRINEDLLFNYYAFKRSKISVFLDEPYYHYMIRKNSASTSEWNQHKLLDPIIVLEKMYQEENDAELLSFIRNRYVYQLIKLMIFHSNYNKSELKKYRNSGRKKLVAELRKKQESGDIVRKNYCLGWLVVLCPHVVYILHEVYGWLRGSRNKYKI